MCVSRQQSRGQVGNTAQRVRIRWVVGRAVSLDLDLDLDGLLNGLSLLLLSGDSLGSHDATTPVTSVLLGLGQVSLVDGRDQLAQLGLVLGLDLGQSQDGGGLLVNDRSQPGLALNNGIWHAHLTAQGRQEHHQLDRVDVVGDQHECGLLVLNQAHNVVQSILGSVWFLLARCMVSLIW